MPARTALLALVAALCGGGAVAQEAPATAIEWLSESQSAPPESVLAPLEPQVTPEAPSVDEPPVTGGVTVSQVTVQPLGDLNRDGIGILSPNITGIPVSAMTRSTAARMAELYAQAQGSRIPALTQLLKTLALAEMAPPLLGGEGPDRVYRARADLLRRLGALEEAQALLEHGGTPTAELFALWFDVSLLTGNDARACNTLQAKPDMTSDLKARVFCLSRGGDWTAAALTLDTGEALGLIAEEDATLLARFLDPEMFEGAAPPAPVTQMTPLRFRLLDGLGETPSTVGLPVAYTVADLRETMGWKARIEAGERLARIGAIGPERLRGLYTERLPAASGGVWDRAEAFQRFDVAALAKDPSAVTNALPGVWLQMGKVGLEVPFATLYADTLVSLPIAPGARDLALKIGLLSPSYEAVALAARDRDRQPALLRDRFALSLAVGEVSAPPPGVLPAAIAEGFTLSGPPETYATQAAEGRLIEALLMAIDAVREGRASDPQDITETLGLLRSFGMHDIARRTALQLLYLER